LHAESPRRKLAHGLGVHEAGLPGPPRQQDSCLLVGLANRRDKEAERECRVHARCEKARPSAVETRDAILERMILGIDSPAREYVEIRQEFALDAPFHHEHLRPLRVVSQQDDRRGRYRRFGAIRL